METPRDPGHAEALALAGRAAAAACGVLAVALAALVLWRSAGLLALLYVAAMLGLALDRPVAALVRRGLGRGWAVGLVLGGAGAFTIAAVVVAFGPLVAQLRGLATVAPAIADRLRTLLVGRFGNVPEGAPLATWFHDVLSRGAGALAGEVYGVAGGVANAAGALATVLVLAVLLLASGPELVQRALRAVPPRRRSRAAALAHELASSLGGYLAGLSGIVAARVLATGALLAALGVPFVIPLSLLAGATVLVPYVGAVLRLVELGVAAWATRGSSGALAVLALVAAYDVAENYVLSPLVFRRALGISPLAQLVAVLFLGFHFGVLGAVLAIPLAATAQIVLRALWPAAGADAPPALAEDRRQAPDPDPAAHRPGSEAPADGRSGG